MDINETNSIMAIKKKRQTERKPKDDTFEPYISTLLSTSLSTSKHNGRSILILFHFV